MGLRKFVTGLFLISTLYTIFQKEHHVHAAPANTNNLNAPHRARKPFVRSSGVKQFRHLRPEPSNEFFVQDEDFFELPKRQSTSDDYGHMRFGKREEGFDDYGHMRFGRNEID